MVHTPLLDLNDVLIFVDKCVLHAIMYFMSAILGREGYGWGRSSQPGTQLRPSRLPLSLPSQRIH